MTKKHYEAIARIFRGIELDTDGFIETHYENIVSRLADYFESENPRFDRDKFLSACGVELK